MKSRFLSLLTVLALVGFMPLAAQTPEDPDPYATDPNLDPVAGEIAQETGEVAAEVEQEAAELEAEVEGEMEAMDVEEELPATASPLPLLALLGGASAATGLALRWRFRNR